MFTKEEILHQLHAFSFSLGRPVTVHTSMKAVGDVEGGAEGLLEVLIRFFTKDGGHLVIPTHTWDSEVYDRREAKTCLGVLPTIAAAHRDGVRSCHPTHSVTIFGEDAENFARLDDSTDSPVNPKGCYGRILEEGGFVLLIGVGHDKNTCIHCAEEMLSVKNRLTTEKVTRKIIHRTGREEVRSLYWFDEDLIPDVSLFFPKFEPAFRFHNCITDGRIGNAIAQKVDAARMRSVIENIYKCANHKELLDNDLPLDKALYHGFKLS